LRRPAPAVGFEAQWLVILAMLDHGVGLNR
jgi:hypothetical protein